MHRWVRLYDNVLQGVTLRRRWASHWVRQRDIAMWKRRSATVGPFGLVIIDPLGRGTVMTKVVGVRHDDCVVQ